LNGDTYSVTTSRHQSDTRSAVARVADKFPSLIVPHSALASAGIDPDSIVPVDIEPERTEEETHRVTVPELVKLAEDKARGPIRLERIERRQVMQAMTRAGRLSAPTELRTRSRSIVAGGKRTTGRIRRWRQTYGGGFVDYDPPRVSYYRNGSSLSHVEGDTFTYSTWRHFLGAACFSAVVTEYSYRPCRSHADNGRGFCDECGYNVDNAPVTLQAGDKVRHSSRPPMVETKRTRRAYFLSAFDSNERIRTTS
jgi:hypothetical protein